MADPVTLGTLALGSSIAGAGTGAVGSIFSGSANAANMQYQGVIAQQNAAIARQNADFAREAGEDQASIAGMKGRQELGQIRAAQGASGFDVTKGTNPLVQSSQQLITQTNEANIRNNAAKQAYGFDVQAVGDTNQANADFAGAANAQTAGTLGAVSSIIGGASSVSTKWLQGTSAGIFPSNDALQDSLQDMFD